MSFNVMIIPEDFRDDQYILKPIIEKMFEVVGKPRARVLMCMELLGGYSEAVKRERIQEIIDDYPLIDLFLLIVDRDGDANRYLTLERIEDESKKILPLPRMLLAEHAWQEIEVWALAGQDLPSDWRWQDIRAERDPKEHYFQPFAESRNLTDRPGKGRMTLGKEAALNYTRVRSRCTEDIVRLEDRIRAHLI